MNLSACVQWFSMSLAVWAVMIATYPAKAEGVDQRSRADVEAQVESVTDSCVRSDNYLRQTNFSAGTGERMAWGSTQHSSKPSFEISVKDDTLTIEQKAREPWIIYRQRIDAKPLLGHSVEFSAELWGEVLAEPKLHGFEHKAGLYYRVNTRSRARLSSFAEHEPHAGQWDWQAMSANFNVPEDARWVEVGFMHQAGGILRARRPQLVIVDCGGR